MENKIIAGVITAAIVIIMTGALLVPVIDDYSDSMVIRYNNDSGRYSMLATSEDLAITISEDKSIVVNGSAITRVGSSQLITTDNCYVRYDSGSGLTELTYNNNGVVSHMGSGHLPFTITANDGQLTFTDSAGSTATVAYSWMLYPADDGDYTMFYNYSGNVYVNDVSQIYYSGYGGSAWFSGIGQGINSTADTAEIAINTTPIVNGGAKSIYYFTTTSNTSTTDMLLTLGETSYALRVFYAPLQVEGIDQANQPIIPILSVIPVILIVAVLASIIMMIRFKN